MKPYCWRFDKGSSERIFNYRLSRARRIVENAFGILTAVFIIYRRPINLLPQNVVKVILATVALHNFLRRNKTSRDIYSPPNSFDAEDFETGQINPGTWRRECITSNLKSLQSQGTNTTLEAEDIRNTFASYFMSDHGSLPWQWHLS